VSFDLIGALVVAIDLEPDLSDLKNPLKPVNPDLLDPLFGIAGFAIFAATVDGKDSLGMLNVESPGEEREMKVDGRSDGVDRRVTSPGRGRWSIALNTSLCRLDIS